MPGKFTRLLEGWKKGNFPHLPGSGFEIAALMPPQPHSGDLMEPMYTTT